MAVACVLAYARQAEATLIQVDFSGTVVSVGALVAAVISESDPVSGRFVYDTGAGVTLSGPAGRSVYEDAAMFSVVRIGSYAITRTSTASVTVLNDCYCAAPGVPAYDGFFADAGRRPLDAPYDASWDFPYDGSGIEGPLIGGLRPFRLQFGGFSYGLTVLASEDLPTALELLGFAGTTSSGVNFLFFGPGTTINDRIVRWDVTDFSAVALPEQRSLTLLALLMSALALFRLSGVTNRQSRPVRERGRST